MKPLLITSTIMNSKLILLLLIHLFFGIFIGHYIIDDTFSSSSNYVMLETSKTDLTDNLFRISPNVTVINTSVPIDVNFRCIKTKTLLNHINTHICLYETQKDIYVSSAFRENVSIWEESGVIRILELLLRNPHLDFIDIGANIGTYTMYAAALGRFVLAVECFSPNVNRIHRAVQLSNVGNRVVIVQNALFTRSGQLLRLSNDAVNVGGQEVDASANQTFNHSIIISDPFIVKTITFDEVAPILRARGVRGAIMKVDIEGSESFVVESGSQIFDQFEIPFIVMEWLKIRHIPSRVKTVIDFFEKRNYIPKALSCQLLDPIHHGTWPDDMCWVKRNFSGYC